MKLLRTSAVVFVLIVALLLTAGQLGQFAGNAPADLGVHDGLLKRPSENPNSVSSQAALWSDHPQGDAARIAPLALQGDGRATIDRVQAIVADDPGASVVVRRPDYLRVEYTTRLMGFVDDVEFWFDPANGVIQVRSASRLGRSDFGVNRQRIEELRRQLAAAAS